jgi:hypothetical protein
MLSPNKLEENLLKAYDLGLIAKDALKDGHEYFGKCRNAEKAVWNSEKQKFLYVREKFSSLFHEEILHPEDDEGFDIFVPVFDLGFSMEHKFCNYLKEEISKYKLTSGK